MGFWNLSIIDSSELDLPVEEQTRRLGNLKLLFHGNRIRGKFALVRTGVTYREGAVVAHQEKGPMSQPIFLIVRRIWSNVSVVALEKYRKIRSLPIPLSNQCWLLQQRIFLITKTGCTN